MNRPKPYLAGFIFALVLSGIYTLNHSLFDLGIVLVAGLIGYLMRILGFPFLPAVLWGRARPLGRIELPPIARPVRSGTIRSSSRTGSASASFSRQPASSSFRQEIQGPRASAAEGGSGVTRNRQVRRCDWMRCSATP